MINQDDEFSLEMELAERYCHEAQVQSYHFARALINLAEIHGRKGNLCKAQRYFAIMESIYMPTEHPKLLSAAYNVDRCAVGFATSALWLLQQGDVERAIERCEYVIKNILPSYDEKDIIGLFTMLLPIVRVLKWNGNADRAYEVYEKYTPDGIENHFAFGALHKPMLLLLKLCSNDSSDQFNSLESMSDDIELALTFEPTDQAEQFYTCECWSMKSLCAELCVRLACQLKPGNPVRDDLIRKGILMSTAANQLAIASNGTIKHILAYEGNSGIHVELLQLAKEDTGFARGIFHEEESGMEHLTDSSLSNGFSRKLVVSASESANVKTSSRSKVTGLTISSINLKLKKKVSFSGTSSLGSHSSGLKQSHDSISDK
mmetsp:Transcript_30873/g.46822  ORF Transcript_30873/g.46822 Transcript_30873/m.46822 type:complete len:375 (-) Transcript_30873:97-1221(-)